MEKGFKRVDRVGEQIRRELAESLNTLMSEYPQASMISFTAVKVLKDLSQAKVYFTFVISDQDEREKVVDLLNSKSKAFKHYLAKNMKTRTVPELTFVYDESVEYGARMEAMLKELVNKHNQDEQ